MGLKIYLLGQFSLQANEQPIELPSRPAQSLLAYLALNAGASHRRERLAGLLWPEATEGNARSYLRQALWRIRKSLDSASLNWEDYMQITDISMTFNPQADCWIDTEVFLADLAGRPLDEMVETIGLYRGELLPGFYDEWVLVERDRIQAAYHQKMKQLLESLIQARRFDEALEWGEQWIRLGHSPEAAFRALMRTYAGLGDQSMVSVTYQRCVETLDRELGLEPSSSTQTLYQQLISGELDLTPPAPIVAHDDAPSFRPSFLDEQETQPEEKMLFVARERELGQLEAYLGQSLLGQGRVTFITGESGSGKSALIEEFVARAQDKHDDLVVASGYCNAHTGIGDPYLPFREILELLSGDVEARFAAGAITREHARRLWSSLPKTISALAELGPSLLDTFIIGSSLVDRTTAFVSDSPHLQSRLDVLIDRKASGSMTLNPKQIDLFEQYTSVLGYLARQMPLVLVVDDLQWADLGSISLLFHLGRHIHGRRILILGAYRPEEVSLGRDGERHPLEPVVNEFIRQFGDSTINLDRAEGAEFVEAILDSEPNSLGGSFRKMLGQQAQGNPLFTIELLRGMQERGDLRQEPNGLWVEGPELDWETLPVRIEAVIAQRIGRLPQSLQEALHIASVEGDEFTAEVLARLLNIDEQEILRRLSRELDRKHRLIRAQSIVRMDGQLLSRFRFRHTLFQKYLYGSLDEVELVHLHARTGTVLEELYGQDEQSSDLADIAPQLARHFKEARNPEKAIHYHLLAGDKALQLSAYQEASVHLRKGIASLKEMKPSSEQDRLEIDLQCSLGIALIGIKGMAAPEVNQALSRARELCELTGRTIELCHVLGETALVYMVRSEHRQAKELALEALKLAEEIGDPLLVAKNHLYLGLAMFYRAEFQEALHHIGEMTDFYRLHQHQRSLDFIRVQHVGLTALAYQACCLWCLGYPDQALQVGEEAISLARVGGHPFSLADVLCFGGCVLCEMRRDIQHLIEYAEELANLSQETSLGGWEATGLFHQGIALAISGHIADGLAKLREAFIVAKSTNVGLYNPAALGYVAETEAQDGRVEDGLITLQKAFDLVEAGDERMWEAELFRIKGELLLMKGDEDQTEINFKQAIDVAQSQQAKSWELRASTSLARLMMEQQRMEEARRTLQPIYDWFDEGFDTPDLQEAGKLLTELI